MNNDQYKCSYLENSREKLVQLFCESSKYSPAPVIGDKYVDTIIIECNIY